MVEKLKSKIQDIGSAALALLAFPLYCMLWDGVQYQHDAADEGDALKEVLAQNRNS